MFGMTPLKGAADLIDPAALVKAELDFVGALEPYRKSF
jgi:hypothetical protein